MAGFQLKLEQKCLGSCECASCDSITVYDGSGIYNASTNPTGYGTPNIEYTEVTNALLTWTDSSGATGEVDVTSYYSDIADLGTDMVITADFADGLVQVTLTIQGVTGSGDDIAPFRYTDTIAVWFDCAARLCVGKLLSEIDTDCDCGCKDEKNERAINAMLYLEAAKYNATAECCNYAKANKLLAAAQAICEADCNDC